MARGNPDSQDELLAKAEEFEKQANRMRKSGDRASEKKLRRKADAYLNKATAA